MIVLSPYQSNISPMILNAQRAVFEHLGIALSQVNIDGQEHGAWMDQAACACTDELIVFCDIDAFPVTRAAFDGAIAQAKKGHLVGMAQRANHFDPDHIYAGPMFLAMATDTYAELGQPTLARKDGNDAAQYLSRVAADKGTPITLLYPSVVIDPRWNLSTKGVFGIGTFYADNSFFHLFQARLQENITLFERVAQDIQQDRLDFESYLALRNPPKTAPVHKAFLKSIEHRLKKVLKR